MQTPSIIEYRDRNTDSELIDFLNSELRPEAKISGINSIEKEYPSLFSPLHGGISFCFRENGKYISHVGCLMREYVHRFFRIKVGLIGSVVTSKDYQGHGYASQLLQAAVQKFKEEGCEVAILWTDMPEYYETFGFVQAGQEVDLRFSVDTVLDSSLVPERAKPEDIESVLAIYLRKEGHLQRSLTEMQQLAAIPGTQLYVTRRNGCVTSYLAIQKGEDFKNYIHEWGGDHQELIKAISWIQKNDYQDRPLTLISPPYEELEALESIAEFGWNGVLGMIKILDLPAILKSYQKLYGKSAIEESSLPPEVLYFGNGATSHPTLPFFLWGFDSI